MKSNPYIDALFLLKGGTITDIVYDDSDPSGDPYCGFIVSRPEAVYQVVALRDPEGNGAGFVEVTQIKSWQKHTCTKCGTMMGEVDKSRAIGTMGVLVCEDCNK